MHLEDRYLTDAPLTEMLAACNVVLQEIGRGDIYERHYTGSTTRAEVRISQGCHWRINKCVLIALLDF